MSAGGGGEACLNAVISTNECVNEGAYGWVGGGSWESKHRVIDVVPKADSFCPKKTPPKPPKTEKNKKNKKKYEKDGEEH